MDAQFDQEFATAKKEWTDAAKTHQACETRKNVLWYAREIVDHLSKEKHSSGNEIATAVFGNAHCNDEVAKEASKLAARLGYKLVRDNRVFKYGLAKAFEITHPFKKGDRVLVSCESKGFAGKIGVIEDFGTENATCHLVVDGIEGWVDLKYLSLVPDR